ncbi:MAG: hypothetical protein QM811_24195 [Pirellulales bacterium]
MCTTEHPTVLTVAPRRETFVTLARTLLADDPLARLFDDEAFLDDVWRRAAENTREAFFLLYDLYEERSRESLARRSTRL